MTKCEILATSERESDIIFEVYPSHSIFCSTGKLFYFFPFCFSLLVLLRIRFGKRNGKCNLPKIEGQNHRIRENKLFFFFF